MIVEEDHGGGIGLEHDAHDLARMHRGAGDRAAEEDLRADKPMTRVEEQQTEDFVRKRADLVAQVLARSFGAAEDRCAGAEVLRHDGCGTVKYFLGGGFAKLVAVADKKRVSHSRRLQVKLTTALPRGT